MEKLSCALLNYDVDENGIISNRKTGHIIKQTTTDQGYKIVALRINGKSINVFVHRLVAYKYVNGYKQGLVVHHKDYDKSNNNYKNLEWVTIGENNRKPDHVKNIWKHNQKEVMVWNYKGFSKIYKSVKEAEEDVPFSKAHLKYLLKTGKRDKNAFRARFR